MHPGGDSLVDIWYFFCDIIHSGATVSALRLCQRLVHFASSMLATNVFILLFSCSLPSRHSATLCARSRVWTGC